MSTSAISAARRRRGLELDDIARTTRLPLKYVQAIDEGRFGDLPSGLYARAYVRAVSGAVGLDPAEVDEILVLLAPPPDPLPVLEELEQRRSAHEWVFPELRFLSAHDWAVPELRLLAAATFDALLLLILNALALTVAAAACGVSVRTLVQATPLPLFVFCASTWIFYFILLGGVQGRTAGQHVCGIAPRHDTTPLKVRSILQRAAGLDHVPGVR